MAMHNKANVWLLVAVALSVLFQHQGDALVPQFGVAGGMRGSSLYAYNRLNRKFYNDECESSLSTDLFDEVLTRHLKTLALATKCDKAFIYLQSEEEHLFQVVCRYPLDCTVSPEEEFIHYECALPEEACTINPLQWCAPKSTRGAVDCPITHRSDYFGLLRVAFDADATNAMAEHVEALVTSTAQALASSIKLEHMHYNNALGDAIDTKEEVPHYKAAVGGNGSAGGAGGDAGGSSGSSSSRSSSSSELALSGLHHHHHADALGRGEDDDDLFSGIWMTVSNSIKTARTMLKMLARRNIREGDDIGMETYDNIQLQLESIGASLSPLRPQDRHPDDADHADDYNDYDLVSSATDDAIAVPLILRRSDTWSNNQVETSVVFDKGEENEGRSE